jgi:hypothetical protein
MVKPRTKPPTVLRQVTLDEFDRDLSRALSAARKAGGVRVVDADGNTRFHMSIPRVALSVSRR